MEWTITELADRAGISGRTLRYYHRIGLLAPDRVGENGYRYYGPHSVARLQRILLLRQTGMPLADIARVLRASTDPAAEIAALEGHLTTLEHERMTLDQRIRSVEHTLVMRREGRAPRMDVMLDGFNDRYEQEVVRRWGQASYDAANQWWHGKSVTQQRAWQDGATAILLRWRELQQAGHAVDSPAAQAHAKRHVAWLAAIPGTPTHDGDAERSRAMICGAANMFDSNPDFHEAFGSAAAARYAATALRRYVGD